MASSSSSSSSLSMKKLAVFAALGVVATGAVVHSVVQSRRKRERAAAEAQAAQAAAQAQADAEAAAALPLPLAAAETKRVAVAPVAGGHGGGHSSIPAALPALHRAHSVRSRVHACPITSEAPLPLPPADPTSNTLLIITINDVYKVDNFAKLRTFIHERMAAKPFNRCLITLPGDFLGPSPMSAFDKGHHMVTAMNLCGFTHICVGNHEFDGGFENLESRLEQLRAGCGAKVLNSNIANLKGGIEHDVIDIPIPGTDRKFRVGMFGTCTDETVSMLTPTKMGECKWTNHMESNAAAANKLKDEQKCDFVIALTHQWAFEDRKTLLEVPSIDLLLGGHDHMPYIESAGPEAKDTDKVALSPPLPVVATPGGGARWLVKVGEDATHVGVIEVDIRTGAITTVERHALEEYKIDPTVQLLVEWVNTRVAEFQGFMLYGPESHLSSVTPRRHQTTVGVLFATLLKDWQEVDICLFHSGGIRNNKNYRKGFFVSDLSNELPYPNHCITFGIKGSDLLTVLLESQHKNFGNYGAYFQFDGDFEYDHKNKRIVMAAGRPFDPEHRYRVLLNEYSLFKKMDNLESLQTLTKEKKIDGVTEQDLITAASGPTIQEILLDAMVQDNWTRIFIKEWDEMDTNQDGSLDHAELAQVLTPETLRLLTPILKLADKNQDGKIQKEEYKSAVAKALARRGARSTPPPLERLASVVKKGGASTAATAPDVDAEPEPVITVTATATTATATAAAAATAAVALPTPSAAAATPTTA